MNAISINDLYVPEDAADDMREDIVDIYRHIPDGWGRWISCDSGWYRIIIDTHRKLKYIDPNYEIHQIKEKFGGLRYYYQSSFDYDSIQEQIMETIISVAEEFASNTCEICGANDLKAKAKTRVRNRWYKTLCIKCATEHGYSIEDSDEE